MMESIDWSREAKLLERDDSGSDWDVDFKLVAAAPLSVLVAKVVAMAPANRARVIIDRGIDGTIAYADIIALAARADFPGE
jgi:hypothetical protein